MAEFSEWEKKLEKLQNERAKEISKKSEWARLLGCKPDKKPWTMSFNVFGAANKLIARIERISDQELLALIAREAHRPDIKCAAIRNITDQKLLKFFLCSNNQLIREAAITHLEDQKLLEELALDERYNSIDVRRSAIAKLKNPAVLQKISGSNTNLWIKDVATLRLLDITTPSEDELLNLTLSAASKSIKLKAINKLPQNKAETKLLEIAIRLENKITAIDVDAFYELYKDLKVSNPAFLKKIAESYPDVGVRYLARGKQGLTHQRTGSFEGDLKSWTPSKEELRKRDEIRECDDLLDYIRRCVLQFINLCNQNNGNGERSAEMICFSPDIYQTPFTNYYDADVVVELLKIKLKENKFHHAVVNRESYYSNSEFAGYVVKIRTSW